MGLLALSPSIPLSQFWERGRQEKSCSAPLLPFWEKGLGDEGHPLKRTSPFCTAKTQTP